MYFFSDLDLDDSHVGVYSYQSYCRVKCQTLFGFQWRKFGTYAYFFKFGARWKGCPNINVHLFSKSRLPIFWNITFNSTFSFSLANDLVVQKLLGSNLIVFSCFSQGGRSCFCKSWITTLNVFCSFSFLAHSIVVLFFTTPSFENHIIKAFPLSGDC